MISFATTGTVGGTVAAPVANGGIIPADMACIGAAWLMLKAAVGTGAVFNGAIGAPGGIVGIPEKIIAYFIQFSKYFYV